jgi:hypothetical protein
MYKIRTMHCNAEAESGPVWAVQGDPRITPLGYWLRKLHLDELPQLFNVVKGEMVLIGPRPERPEFTQQLMRQIPNYLDRLMVKPGITGLAQINLPPDTDLDSVRRKLALDLEYVSTASLLLDWRMLVCTGLRMIGVHGDTAMRICRLERIVNLPTKTSSSAGSHEDPTEVDDAALNGSSKPDFLLQGTAQNSAQGAQHHGSLQNGAALNGSALNGSALNGSGHNGAAVNGSHHHGGDRPMALHR